MVEIKLNKTTGVAVNKYANSTKDFGFMNIQSQSVTFNGNRLNSETRSCLLRGNIDELQTLANDAKDGKLPGKIRIYEVTEDIARDVAMGVNSSEAHNVAKGELHSELLKTDFEGAIEGYLKKNPQTDSLLTKDGQRILRFQVYDPTGQLEDIFIRHDRENTPATSHIDANTSLDEE